MTLGGPRAHSAVRSKRLLAAFAIATLITLALGLILSGNEASTASSGELQCRPGPDGRQLSIAQIPDYLPPAQGSEAVYSQTEREAASEWVEKSRWITADLVHDSTQSNAYDARFLVVEEGSTKAVVELEETAGGWRLSYARSCREQ